MSETVLDIEEDRYQKELRRIISLTEKYSLYNSSDLRSLPQFLQQAIMYELIKPGYDYSDYMNEAWHGDEKIMEKFGIKKQGFGEALYWAPQGTFKSNVALQHGYKVYGNWDVVLKRNIMTLEELVELYNEAKETSSYIPWVNIDDVSMVFSKQMWFEKGGLIDETIGETGRDIYIMLDKVLAGIRRRVSWLSFSTPYPENTIKPLARNLSYEIWVYPTPGYIVNKYVRLIDPYREMKSNLRKIVIEHSNFDPTEVNLDTWKIYSEKRDKADNQVFRPLQDLIKPKGVKNPKLHVTLEKFTELARQKGIKAQNDKLHDLWRTVSDLAPSTDDRIADSAL